MFNVLFLIWYFLTLIIMIIAVFVLKLFENFKELKRLRKENAYMKTKIEILNDENRDMNKMNKILAGFFLIESRKAR